MNGKNYDTEAENAFNSLEGMQRAAAPPFLYTRVQARLQQGTVQPLNFRERLAGLLAKPATALATVVLIAAINVVLILNRNNNDSDAAGVTTEVAADAYNANMAMVYDTDNFTEQ